MDPFECSDLDTGSGELCENTENNVKKQTRGQRGARGRKKIESVHAEVMRLWNTYDACCAANKMPKLEYKTDRQVKNSEDVQINDQHKDKEGKRKAQKNLEKITKKEKIRLNKLSKRMEDYCKNAAIENPKQNPNKKERKQKYLENGQTDNHYEKWIKNWEIQSKLQTLTRKEMIKLFCETFHMMEDDENIPIGSRSKANENKKYSQSTYFFQNKIDKKQKMSINADPKKKEIKKSVQGKAHFTDKTVERFTLDLSDLSIKEEIDQLGITKEKKKSAASQKKTTENIKKKKVGTTYSMEKEYSVMELASHEQRSNKSTKDDVGWTFARHIRKRDALKLLERQDSDEPTVVKGYIRINPKNYNQAFISVENGLDIRITDAKSRNRAMEKDLVVVSINPREDWWKLENQKLQKTGTVISILEKHHSRKVVGTLKEVKERFKLKSRDNTVSEVFIDPKSIPKEILSSPKSMKKTLFLANIDHWLNPFVCKGTIECIVGNVGDLENETSAILLAKGLDVTPYDDELMKELPSDDYLLVDSDLDGREDWRGECVFTIDPATAVDLDDAVSCKKLQNGNYEIAVHISDVTHYLKAFSPLDEEVSKRATTVYLVNTVYHMLPKSLCKLCSLLPGKEKLSFSVIWEMTPEAEIVKHRFAKTIIRSSYQMSYEQAQLMIDQPSREWTIDDLPNFQGNHSPDEICKIVNILYRLSTRMRDRRFSEGALCMNLPKLQIILDDTRSYPVSFRLEERQDSNRLIEEFMLLANMTVARHLYENMSDSAFLRIHEEPLLSVLSQTARDLSHLGVHLNTDSAGGLQSSMLFYEKSGLEGYYNEFATNCRMMVINMLCAQSMPRAKYLCSGTVTDKEQLRHFALNVPFYTHFTSPIRRYADCVVHRLLFASMTNSPMPDKWSADLCAKIAANCNVKKYNAKMAQEESNELYFIDLLSRNGPMETMAIVMKVKQRSMDVILCHVGMTVTVFYTDSKKDAQIEYNNEHSVYTLIVKWNDPVTSQTINVFSLVTVRIEKHPKKYSIRGTLLPTRSIENSSDP